MTLIFRLLKHPATDPFSSRRCIDIHPPQLHRVGRGALQTECADEPIASDRHPKAAVVLAIIGGNPINLLGQRTFNVSFKGIAQVRRVRSRLVAINSSRTWEASPSANGRIVISACKFAPHPL